MKRSEVMYCVVYFMFSIVILLAACAMSSASAPVSRHPLQDANGDFPARVAVRDLQPVANCRPYRTATRPTVVAEPELKPAVDTNLGVDPAGYFGFVDGRLVWCPRGGCRPGQPQPQPYQPQPVEPPQFDFNEDEEDEKQVEIKEEDVNSSAGAIVAVVLAGVAVTAAGAATGAYVQWKQK